ncbi:hypothetical protein [Blastococcus sp. LR1]|uniref:hypothetical protein n=1 Tax=Blastococcus sp. LR1 TaxID=2877000 RepID=UPI001CC8F693|nr:hypothetical protein [Blastococcus sp. LR1]MCA0146261.1 hypothetical protein [Blastococcus sp. LR1]
MTGSDDSSDPPLFSKRWWTDTNPYWGEWRSGPWGWFYLGVAVVLVLTMAALDGTWQGWATATALLVFVLAGTWTARPGRRSDAARLRRHQHRHRNGSGRDG